MTTSGQLDQRFVEWMMMLDAGWVTDLVPRAAALRLLGNGVVPPQAAYGVQLLLEREPVAA